MSRQNGKTQHQVGVGLCPFPPQRAQPDALDEHGDRGGLALLALDDPEAIEIPEPTPTPSTTEAQPEVARLDTFKPPVIKVVGVGGGGCNAVSRMIEVGLTGVEFVAVNTDSQALVRCNADRRLHIGARATRGLGAGADPEMGRTAVEEDRDEIRDMLEGSDMVFVTTGMGGGTGTGASPVVAEIAQELGILTVGIVTRPFSFEGSRRTRSADEGIKQIQEKVDALITIANDRLVSVTQQRTSILEAFHLADDVLRAAVQGICDIIRVHGRVNVDFADVQTILRKSGSAVIGIGQGHGEARAVEAAQAAISSPLLENSFHGARGILFNITGGPGLSLHEVDEAARVISAAAHPDANVIYGVVVEEDPDMEDVTVTVVASGFTPSADEGLPEPPVATDAYGVPPSPLRDVYEVPAFLRNHR